MLLNHRLRERRHDGAVFVDTRRHLISSQPLDALAGVSGLKTIVTTRRDALQYRAASIAAGIVAKGPVPTTVMPWHSNGQVMNR